MLRQSQQDVVTVVGAGVTLFESAAVPKNYTNLDFEGYQRWGLSLGATVRVWKYLDINAAYMHLFQTSRTVAESETKVMQQRPGLDSPDNVGSSVGGGSFKSGIDVMSIGANFHY